MRFWPDWDIFDADASIDIEQVRDHVATMCFLVPGLKVVLVDKRAGGNGEPEEFVSARRAGRLSSTTSRLARPSPRSSRCTGSGTFQEKVPVDGKMPTVERDCQVDVALRWVKGYDTHARLAS